MKVAASILFFLVALKLHAQQFPANIRFVNYGRETGLPNNYCSSIAQDSRGHLWIGSYEGLHRYDGFAYKSFYANHGKVANFKSNYTTVVGEVTKGYVTFISYSQLYHINVNTHQILPLPIITGKKLLSTPKKINAQLFVAVTIDSIYLFDTAYIVRRQFQNTIYKGETQVLALSAPEVLLSSGNCITRFNYYTGESKPLLIDYKSISKHAANCYFTHFDSIQQRLYLAYYFTGNYYLDYNTNAAPSYVYKPKAIPAMLDGAFKCAYAINPNFFIFGTEHALVFTNGITQKSFAYTDSTESPIQKGVVVGIAKAKDGSFWTSSSNGISQLSIKQNIVHSLRKPLKLKYDEVFKKLVLTSNGKLLALGLYTGLYQADKNFEVVQHIATPMNYCWDINEQKNNYLLAGNAGHLYSINKFTLHATQLSYLKPFCPPNFDLVTLAFTARNGDCWYSINAGGGLVHFVASQKKYQHFNNKQFPKPFSGSYYRNCVEASNGDMWFATASSLVLHWVQASNTFQEIEIATMAKGHEISTGVTNLFLDANNNLWLSLDGDGLLKYSIDKKSGEYFCIGKGLPTNAINGFCTDAKQRLWINTSKGLCCFFPSSKKFLTFGKSDGFFDDAFDSDGILYDSVTNRIYTSSSTALYYFNVDSLLATGTICKAQLYIDEMFVNGEPIVLQQGGIELAANQNNLIFQLSAVDYYRNAQLEFSYSLDSIHWISIGNTRSITFTAMPSGKHTLYTRCKYQGADEWVAGGNTIQFVVATPWYKSWWFTLLMLLALGALIWYISTLYFKRKLVEQKAILDQQRAVQVERFRIASDMHDDLGTSLSRIRFVTSNIPFAKTEDEKNKSFQKIIDLSDDSVEKMNEIIWSLKQDKFTLDEMLSYVRKICGQLSDEKNVAFHLSFDESSEQNELNAEQCRNVYLVIKETIHNAMKYAQCKNVWIKVEVNQLLQVQIKDDGIGFDVVAKSNAGNGLGNMHNRINIINGSISISSGASGTITYIAVPLKK